MPKHKKKEEDVIVLYKPADEIFPNEKELHGKFIITWVMADMVPNNPMRGIQIPGPRILFTNHDEIKQYTKKVVEKNTSIRNFIIVLKKEEAGLITIVNGINPIELMKNK